MVSIPTSRYVGGQIGGRVLEKPGEKTLDPKLPNLFSGALWSHGGASKETMGWDQAAKELHFYLRKGEFGKTFHMDKASSLHFMERKSRLHWLK